MHTTDPEAALLLGHQAKSSCVPSSVPHAADPEAAPLPGQALLMRTFQLPGKGRVRLTLLPPPSNRGDLMAVVDIGRAAEVRGW